MKSMIPLYFSSITTSVVSLNKTKPLKYAVCIPDTVYLSDTK